MAELKVHGVGVATADPELKFIGDKKTPVCNVNLAFNRSFKKGDDWEQETSFMRVQMFGKRGERLAEMAKKGSLVYIEGYIVQNSWVNKEEEKRTMLLINGTNFQICVKNSANGDAKKPEVPVGVSSDVDDENMPF